MIKKRNIVFVILFFIILAVILFKISPKSETEQFNLPGIEGELISAPHELSIEALRKKDFPGSDMVIEQTLGNGSNYKRFIASYQSEGLKIYGLLTLPTGEVPEGGWPAIIFNHGYIPPKEYQTTERYVSYVDGFAGGGYVVFKPDYRGHGSSEGEPSGAYGSNGYTADVLNAVSSIKKYHGVNPQRIGMWGHSLGGFLTLRAMVTSGDIKAGVIWAGVVASYEDLFYNWRRRSFTPPSGVRSSWRQTLVNKFGEPSQNLVFWNSLSANSYLKDLSGPLQLHHATGDTHVPVDFSKKLEEQMKKDGKEVELFVYEGDDHNLSANFNLAMSRSLAFFDKYLNYVKHKN